MRHLVVVAFSISRWKLWVHPLSTSAGNGLRGPTLPYGPNGGITWNALIGELGLCWDTPSISFKLDTAIAHLKNFKYF